MTGHDAQDLPRRIADLDGRDAYAVLGVGATARDEEIAAAYRREMARSHPDRGGSADRAQLVNCAFEVLTRYRDSYDELLADHLRTEGNGPETIFVEPDADPVDVVPTLERGPWPARRVLALLALAVAVAVCVVVVRNARSPEPAAEASGWTTSEARTVTPEPPFPTDPTGTGLAAAPAPGRPPASVVASGSAPAAAGGHRCEIRGDGSLWCAGGNARGQLGIGSTTAVPAPVRVDSVPGTWVAVAVGGSATCGLNGDGRLWCWGDNTHGQLGDGTNSLRGRPVPVQSPYRWLAVDLDIHACAVRADHTLWCWGAGKNGQLGDGGGAGRATPVQLGREATWAAVTVGQGWTCAVRQDGSQACWGARPRRS
ncbi:MAG: hypothetical protein QG622_1042 [Actinomycetota bacterium]|nr:hypothetical protein [Actinomycetota bacterium]